MCAAVLCGVACCFGLASIGRGQSAGGEYIVPPVEETLQRQRFDISRILRNGQFQNDEERQQFDRYYRRFAFPRWAQPDSHNKLPALRKELRNELRTGKSGAPHDRLNRLALDYMKKVAAHPRVHPAVRVNAMLMIGGLNQVEVVRPGDLPVPWAEALPVLLEAFRSADQAAAVRAAAAVGLRYHAEFGESSDASRAMLIDAILPLVTQAKPPPELSPDGYLWLRMRAVETLGLLGDAGEDGEVARAIATLPSRETEPMLLRCTAADALGRLDYAGVSSLDTAAVARALGRLAADAVGEELDAMRDAPAGFSRSRIKHRLLCVQYGLVGDEEYSRIAGIVSAAAGADDRKAIERYSGPVVQAVELLGDKRAEDATIAEGLETLLGQLAAEQQPEQG